ncbi:MAG TPA: glutaredoxin family protein [Terriglobia bacterium]|nr:glutaredoxin family protein [Terriglobia bacterium]
MKITLYTKSGCPWAAAIIGFLNELNVPYETRNITTHLAYARELKGKSGKCISPTLDIDGAILADASVEGVAKVLEKAGVVI